MTLVSNLGGAELLRKICCCSILLLLLLFSPAQAACRVEPDLVEQMIDQQLQAVDTAQIEALLRQMQQEYAGLLPDITLRGVLQSIRQQEGLAVPVLKAVLQLALREVTIQSALLLRLLVLAMLCVLLQHLHTALGGKVADIAYLVCYLIIMGFALQSFGRAMALTRNALTEMISFVYALYPMLLTILLSLGNVSSAALFNPMLMVVLSGISTLIVNVAVPLIFFSGVLILANNLSQNIKVSRLAFILRDVGAGIMGVLFMSFVGFNLAHATVGAVADGVVLRAGKFATKVFLPVVGSMISDGFETIAGCTALIGNALSLVGVIGVGLICALPASRIIGLLIVYRVAAAIMQPFGGGRLSDALNEIAGVFTYFFGVLALVGIMLFVLIAIVVSTGNSALMLR